MRASRLLAVVVTVLLMTALVSAGAFAQEVAPGGGGNEFGEHVSGMSPEHPKDHGQEFGECVSTMAQTGDCPHHH